MKTEDGLGIFSSGGGMNPAWGALIGGGLTSAGLLLSKGLTRRSSKWNRYAGAVGFAAGGIPSIVLMFSRSERTKKAGYLGLAVSAIGGLTELIKDVWIEPKQLADGIGLYETEMTDAERIAILGADDYGVGLPALGQGAPIEILGQATPAQAMGLYQPEMTDGGMSIGANPLDVMGGGGVQPYSGTF